MNKDDEWVRIAGRIDRDAAEEAYSGLFPSRRGRPAILVRMALGALIIQKRMKLSDRELEKEIARNPYCQHFMGLRGYRNVSPVKHGVMPELRKRFSKDVLVEISEKFLKAAKPTAEHAGDKQEKPRANGNLGTMMLDATCSPVNIRFPQDFSLLNEAREKLDAMIDELHPQAKEARRPRTYRRALKKAYLAMAKAKKRPAKKMRALVRKLLCAVKRNMDFVDGYLASGLALGGRGAHLDAMRKLYAQQKEMFDEKKHRVADRIVSVTQPHVRPIVRGKARTPVEFGPKYDVSVDERGHARLEKISFDACNECSVMIDALKRFKARTGHYPARALVDQTYRAKENREFCKANGFQGGECDVILFLLGLNADRTRGQDWYVTAPENKYIYNVSVSRAKHLFVAFGDRKKVAMCGLSYIQRLIPETRPPRKVSVGPGEERLRLALQRAGIETIPQFPVLNRYLDLAIPALNIDIEVDGQAYHLDCHGCRKADDTHRDIQLQAAGWHTIRFWHHEVVGDVAKCVQRIKKLISELKDQRSIENV